VNLTIQNRGAFLKMVSDAAALDEDIKRAIREIAREYNRIVAAELARPKSGKFYGARSNRARYRSVRRRVVLFGGKKATVTRRERLSGSGTKAYRASRPGEAPAVFTGNLLRGLRIAFPRREKGYGAKVFSRKGLAAHRHLLEFGTAERIQKTWRGKRVNRRVGRVAPRPIWTPLQKRAEEDLERRLLRVIDASAAFRG
jgi:hypothetical protein